MPVRECAEDLKANLGTGDIDPVGWENRITLQKKGKSNPTTGFWQL